MLYITNGSQMMTINLPFTWARLRSLDNEITRNHNSERDFTTDGGWYYVMKQDAYNRPEFPTPCTPLTINHDIFLPVYGNVINPRIFSFVR